MYTTFNKAGEPVNVYGINTILKQLKLEYELMAERNNKLREENYKLQSETYKDEEIQQLTDKINKLQELLKYSIEINKDEYEEIESWKRRHTKAKHWDKGRDTPMSAGAIGGRYNIVVTQTSIGEFLSVECDCGAKHNVQARLDRI